MFTNIRNTVAPMVLGVSRNIAHSCESRAMALATFRSAINERRVTIVR
jgi:hypothetical protein